jgi:hypothetical protein
MLHNSYRWNTRRSAARVAMIGGGGGEMMADDCRFSNPVSRRDLNCPGMSGGSNSWEGWSHVRWFIEEVPAGAA